MDKAFRFIVAATPKSGGDWVAGLLSAISGSTLGNFQKIDSHILTGLPNNVVITTRDLPNSSLISNLNEANFHAMTVTRHPFDVLINVLLAANLDIETNTYWGDSLFQFEKVLINVIPRHPIVLQYAAFSRFKDLLAISSRWKHNEGTFSLTFEGLADNPVREMERVLDCDRFQIDVPIEEIIDRQKKRRLGQPAAATLSFTSATSGIWRRLIPAIQAERLESLLSTQMMDLGYQSDPDLTLTADEADINWYRLIAREQIRPLKESLQNYQLQMQVIGADLNTSLRELALRLDSINQFLDSFSISSGLPAPDLNNYQQEALKMGASSRQHGFAWRIFSKILSRLLSIRS